MLPEQLPRLTGETVVLRAFEDRDVPLVLAAGEDPLIPLITTVVACGSEVDARSFIARQQGRLSIGVGYSFAMADVRSDEAVGQIGLWLSEIGHGRATTGYWIGAAFRRRGYARDALQTLTSWALGLSEIDRLQLYVEPWNEASWRTAQACGYQREGRLRSWERVGTRRADMDSYAIVSDTAPG